MKKIIIGLIALSVVVSFCATVYYAIQYIKYAAIARDELALSAFIDSKTEVKEVKNVLDDYTNQVTVNAFNDSINAAFEPVVELQFRTGYDTGYDTRANLHKLGEIFSMGELAFLNQKRVPKSFAWTSNLNSLDVPEKLYAYSGESGEANGEYASAMEHVSIKAVISTMSDCVLGILLLWLVLKSVKHELYPKDFIFIRYDFVNKSHIIGRRLISVFLNVLLVMGCIMTIMLPFIYYDEPYSLLDGSNWIIPFGLSYFMAFFVFFYIITSGIWWILDKDKSG